MQRRTSASAWEEAYGERVDSVDALAAHLRARAALGKVLERLDVARVPALVVKGALLAHQLYASPVERPIRDVDLRVLPGDLERFVTALEGLPFRLVRRSRTYRNLVLVGFGTDIDVETTVGPPFLCRLSVAAMLRRAVRATSPLGFPHWQPELHDHALLLAVNAFKDHLVHASTWSLRDLELVAELPAFDPVVFAARAGEARATTLVHVVARCMGERMSERTGERANASWMRVADAVPPARPAYAEEMLRWLRARRPSSIGRRLRIRAASDARPDALAAATLAIFWEAEHRARAVLAAMTTRR